MGKDEFLSRFENIVEHTPKVAEELLKLRPFENEAVFINSLETVIDNLSHADKVQKFITIFSDQEQSKYIKLKINQYSVIL